MTRPLVVLMDIDGTLITTAGAGRRAMSRGFARYCGRPDALEGLAFGGMTDRAIIRHGLRQLGRAATDAEIDAVLESYLPELADEMSRCEGYRVHSGVAEILDALEARPRTALGLGTGNVAAGARLKLERGDLWRRFTFGGFGDDHEERAELIRAGRDRGAALLGLAPGDCRAVVVGDTVRDLRAARAAGAACVLVGTGGDPLERLVSAGADACFADLSAPDARSAITGE